MTSGYAPDGWVTVSPCVRSGRKVDYLDRLGSLYACTDGDVLCLMLTSSVGGPVFADIPMGDAPEWWAAVRDAELADNHRMGGGAEDDAG